MSRGPFLQLEQRDRRHPLRAAIQDNSQVTALSGGWWSNIVRALRLSRRANRRPPPKPTNPKDAVGLRRCCVLDATHPGDCRARAGNARGRSQMTGDKEQDGVRASVYFDAAMRHLTAGWEGEDTDPASDLPHLVKYTCLAVLRDSQVTSKHRRPAAETDIRLARATEPTRR